MIERLDLTLKQGIAWLTLVPLRRRAFLRELRYLAAWYNSHRPHMTLVKGKPGEGRLSASIVNTRSSFSEPSRGLMLNHRI